MLGSLGSFGSFRVVLEKEFCLSRPFGARPVLQIPLLVMNRADGAESAIFISLVYSLIPKNLFFLFQDNYTLNYSMSSTDARSSPVHYFKNGLMMVDLPFPKTWLLNAYPSLGPVFHKRRRILT